MGSNEFPRQVKVIAYSGYKADERPLAFVLGSRRLEVRDIADRWYGVEHDYFKVVADDGRIYLLRRHRHLDLWFVVKIMERMGRH